MSPIFYSSNDFVERVTSISTESSNPTSREAIFLIGSGLVLPDTSNNRGVPSAEMLTEEIRQCLDRNEEGCRNYQEAFQTLIGVRGQDAANAVVRNAVLQGRNDDIENADQLTLRDLEKLERDVDGWVTPRGLLAIAALAMHFPESYGRLILTTNFDPLIEIALSKMRLPWYSNALQSDGALHYVKGVGSHVVHLHGHWLHSDTLHTSFQLQQGRERLIGSLRRLLRDSTTIVTGYGGWDDVFMSALSRILAEDDTQLDLLWAFYENDEAQIRERYEAVVTKLKNVGGRISFYKGVDANVTFPQIFKRATQKRPAQDLETYIRCVELVTSGKVNYTHLDAPWGDYPSYGSSLGDCLKPLRFFSPTLVAQASLYAVQYLIPRLERWQPHKASTPEHYSAVRRYIKDALTSYKNSDSGDSGLSHTSLGALCNAARDLERRHQHSQGEDRLIFDAAFHAICATIASYQPDHSFQFSVYQEGTFPVEVWAAKSIHLCARVLHDDEATVWSYVTRCLTGGSNHLRHLT